MEWIWERYKVSAVQNKYTARHIISVPAGNGQAGKAPDSRETILSSSPDWRHFYSLQIDQIWTIILYKVKVCNLCTLYIEAHYQVEVNFSNTNEAGQSPGFIKQ